MLAVIYRTSIGSVGVLSAILEVLESPLGGLWSLFTGFAMVPYAYGPLFAVR